MHLYAHYLVRERPDQMANNIRLRHLGRRDGLPESVLDELDESVRQSASNTGMHLCLALNYGSRAEMVDAVRRIARRVQAGELPPEQIDEQAISGSLDSRDIPDPDLLVRTAGEMRISNFLLWQVSYSEFYVTDTLWPDFGPEAFKTALRAYANRHRRFGGVDRSNA
jgi:undecaprenyl diphosphate synthase